MQLYFFKKFPLNRIYFSKISAFIFLGILIFFLDVLVLLIGVVFTWFLLFVLIYLFWPDLTDESKHWGWKPRLGMVAYELAEFMDSLVARYSLFARVGRDLLRLHCLFSYDNGLQTGELKKKYPHLAHEAADYYASIMKEDLNSIWAIKDQLISFILIRRSGEILDSSENLQVIKTLTRSVDSMGFRHLLAGSFHVVSEEHRQLARDLGEEIGQCRKMILELGLED